MAYSAVNDLKGTIERLLYSSDISVAPPSREIAELAYKQVESLEEIVSRMLLRSTSSLDLEIRVAVSKLEDVIRSHLSEQTDTRREVQFSMDPQDLTKAFRSVNEALKKMEEERVKESDVTLPDDDDDDVSSRIGFAGHSSKMVRLSDQYKQLKSSLLRGTGQLGPTVVALVGMPGIGKTTLAMEIFEDSDIVEYYDCRAWVTVGSKYQFKEIPRLILAQLNPESYQMLVQADEDHMARSLEESLKGKRYLIVLDDVRNKYMAHHLHPLDPKKIDELKNPFPFEDKEGRILLTTRLQQVDDHNRQFLVDDFIMRLLSEEESWNLLREKVFAEESCPSDQLEKVGRKIAKNCGGLPLTIVTVAELLSKAEKTPQYWSEVAAQKNHPLLMAAYDKISKVLYSSYEDLTHVLNLCFLYMGVFPQNYEIPRSKLIDMWNVDGFLELNAHKLLHPSAKECLEELVSNSLVMIDQSTVDPYSVEEQKKTWRQIKTCSLHSSLWHLSRRESGKTKFSHVLDRREDGLVQGIKNQSRLSFHNNILFGIQDVYKSVEDNCASTARSLLFYGPYHPYQVPVYFGLKLLKELDALTIRFYEFPLEVLQLVELKYLTLTFNGKLPPSISQLSNLRFLIVRRHLSIKSYKDSSYLPVDIWNMKELQHLQIMGSDLPDPCGASLESLLTLKNVSAHSCTEGALKAVRNLKKLGIRIELAPDDDSTLMSCFDHISHLKSLDSLKCVIVNPQVLPPLAPLSIFPSNLIKLSLSGLGYSWKETSKIASSLVHLMVLKLRNYAFQGPEWEVEKRGFYSLHSLVIEDTDLVEWKVGHKSFYYLKSLSIKHCYKLEKIHGKLEMYEGKIELVDCNPLGVKQIKKAISWRHATVDVHSSWDDDRKLKTW